MEKEEEGEKKSNAGTESPLPAPKLRTEVYPTSPVSELSEYKKCCRIISFLCCLIVVGTVVKVITLLLSPFWITKKIVTDMVVNVFFTNSLPSKIRRSKIETAKYDEVKATNLYVERYSLLEQITDIIDQNSAPFFFVMYGAKGVGKSTIAERAAKDKEGVLMLRIDSTFSRDDIMRQLLEVLKIDERNPHKIDFVNAFSRGKSKEEIHPTLIIEIESAGSDTSLGIQAARDIAADLCYVCSVLIILAEANAVLEFKKLRGRQKFIYVGELSDSEGREYISKLNLNLSDKEIQHVTDNIGTNLATLISMQDWVHGGKSVEKFIAQTLIAAEQDLVNFPHKQILKALKEHPEGVSSKYFKDIMSEGVDLSDPFAVGVAVKQSNAIVYRVELGHYTDYASLHDYGRYMIMSHCHKTALRSYEPILPK